ncbi:Clan CA, family C19, ubiquitin hydrolase-like cysteine peptidase [Tritrichomonas foetus]|uniref:ubiquitinyl hydrolase 1 n=1 Tax=Tritrichomonas foetus TaxID=1144522 RepID=A0A1J4JQK2_9EUKA|nr:Clan CA, family C19, ubiquitin hydrolase-like cysteine peptidase [Tritrichomonas foetus]|eukprot:OHT01034.1 Clan CA, family C19, ubiquitin hydrolase-like cysteine peptidase [Tritrichomonas foetus]
MRHLGTEPHWVSISNKVSYPEDIKKRYNEIMETSVKDFESDFSRILYERRFTVTNMVIQPRGLTNEKLMCFANSSIQLLFASPHFVSFAHFMKTNLPLFSPRQLELVPAWRLFCQFLSGFQFSDSATSDGAFMSLKSLSMTKNAFPTNLKILDPAFGPNFSSTRKPLHQEDATEFLLYFLNKLHDELLLLMRLDPPKLDEGGWRVQGSNRKGIFIQETQGDLSPLSDVFATIIQSDTMEKGVTRSANKESLVVLPLPIRGINTLDDALKQFTSIERIDANISKKSTFLSTPKSLIIGLKRFDYDLYTCTPIKLKQIIEYPDVLTMNRIVDQKQIEYKLCAVVEHIGNTPDGGHYVCYARKLDGSWVKFDDHNITYMDKDQHLGLQAYLLLYNQITSTRNE